MFEWCFRGRYATAAFGIAVAASVASFLGTVGGGPFSIVVGIAVGMPVLVAGSPNLDGEAYLAATDPIERAVDATVTAAVGGGAGLAVTVAAGAVVGAPVPSLLGAIVAVLAGQGAFFYRNRAYLDRGPGDEGGAGDDGDTVDSEDRSGAR